MGIRYTIPIPSTALSNVTSLITLVASATRSLKINEIYLSGGATASAANSVGVYRVGTAGVTPSGAITAAPINPASPAAAFTNATIHVTQPVVGAQLLNIPINGNGGIGYYRPLAGQEIEIPAGAVAAASLTLRGVGAGTSPVLGWITVEEI